MLTFDVHSCTNRSACSNAFATLLWHSIHCGPFIFSLPSNSHFKLSLLRFRLSSVLFSTSLLVNNYIMVEGPSVAQAQMKTARVEVRRWITVSTPKLSSPCLIYTPLVLFGTHWKNTQKHRCIWRQFSLMSALPGVVLRGSDAIILMELLCWSCKTKVNFSW